MKVRVTEDAKADLRQIRAFISNHNAIAADGVIDRIRKTLALLVVLRVYHGAQPRSKYDRS
jgi:plasmid stabilization system protein ParE